jgi:hypothetical protein
MRARHQLAPNVVLSLAATWWVYRAVPGAFVPAEDEGYFITIVQAPSGASIEYTTNVMKEAEQILLKVPEVESVFSVAGFSFSGSAPNQGLIFTLLKNIPPASVRTELPMVAATPKPRLVRFIVTSAGEDDFSLGSSARKAALRRQGSDRWSRRPHRAPDREATAGFSSLILEGDAPAFVRSEELAADGPVWRIEPVIPVWRRRSADYIRRGGHEGGSDGRLAARVRGGAAADRPSAWHAAPPSRRRSSCRTRSRGQAVQEDRRHVVVALGNRPTLPAMSRLLSVGTEIYAGSVARQNRPPGTEPAAAIGVRERSKPCPTVGSGRRGKVRTVQRVLRAIRRGAAHGPVRIRRTGFRRGQ